MKQTWVTGRDGKRVRRIAPETPADVEVMRELEDRGRALGRHSLSDQAAEEDTDTDEEDTDK